MKRLIIKVLDWIDHNIIGHRVYRICHLIGMSSWWDD